MRLLIGETTVEEQLVISGQGGELYAGVGEGLARLARDHRLISRP